MMISHPVFIVPALFLTISHQYKINRYLLTRPGSDYKSPVLYMDNPVFITTRYGFTINQQDMGRVISTQNLGYHLYYKKLVNQRCDSMSQV